MARALQLLTLAALTVQAAALDPSCGGLVRPIAELPSHYQSEVSPSFYAKFVMAAGGVPVVSSTLVSDAALIQMAKVFNWMVCKMPKVADYLGNNRVRLAVMAETEVTTDIPEHSDLGPDPWNRYRGLGHTCGRPRLGLARRARTRKSCVTSNGDRRPPSIHPSSFLLFFACFWWLCRDADSFSRRGEPTMLDGGHLHGRKHRCS